MPDSKYFGIPFGASGDRATIPEATQPGGSVSYQQGFGPDYERDPASDPLAKRVPRPGTNEYLYQITNALKFLQLYGLPEWYQNDDAGNRVSYPLLARVRNGGAAYVSLIANNLATPGTDPASWALDEAFSVAAVEATLAQMLAGTDATKLATPRRVASSVQRGQWNYAVAGGTANALTLALSPAPPALGAGFAVEARVTTTNTGAVTLNVNGLGALAVVGRDLAALNAGDLLANTVARFVHDGTRWVFTGRARGTLIGVRYFTASTTYTPTPGTTSVVVEVQGGGGAGAGGVNQPTGVRQASPGGAGGSYSRGRFTTGFSGAAITVGAAGAGVVGGNGGNGGASSFGALLSAPGGTGGNLGQPVSSGVALTGDTPGPAAGAGGDVNVPGQNGSGSILSTGSSVRSGTGGSSMYGSGGFGYTEPPNGEAIKQPVAGRGFGAGGGGNYGRDTLGSTAGANGAPGIVIVTEYA